MANSFITSSLIAPRAQVAFKMANTSLREAAANYQKLYNNQTFETGNTVNVRLDNQFEVQRGDSVTAKDIVERSVPLTIEELYSVNVKIKPTDLQREIGDFTDHFINPAMENLAAQINTNVLAKANQQIWMYTGSAASNISSYAAADLDNVRMKEMGIPMAGAGKSWIQILTNNDASLLRAALNNNFNQPRTKGILDASSLGRLGAFDIFEDQSLPIHNTFVGAIGTPIVNGAVASGTTIVASGFTASKTGILKAGDIVEFSGSYFVNKVSKLSTGRLYTAIVAADADSSAGGAVTFTINEPIVSTGPRKNISAEIANGATITVIGQTVETTYKTNIAYAPGALILVNPPLEPFRGDDSTVFSKGGMSIRTTFYSDPENNAQKIRIDAQIASRWMGDLAVRHISKV